MAERVRIGDIAIDQLTFEEALLELQRLVERGRGGRVFTPNVDHVVIAEEDLDFRQAYVAADLVLADGMPIVWAARILGNPLPAKISGSDLVMPLMRLSARRMWRVYLLGGAPGVPERALAVMKAQIPDLTIVGTASPVVNTGIRERHNEIIDGIRRADPDVVLVALGAPKQEVFIHQICGELPRAVFVGVGGSLDFIAGVQRRAPRWMSEFGLEWFYRLMRDPRRLWRRYLVRDPRFLVIIWRGWRERAHRLGNSRRS